MSEPRLISPMLDGFVMGDAISEHHGVRCCPAMVKETGSKYIVKIISVPASQLQVEALLLTGACASEAAALTYFKEQAQAIIEEVDTLRKLSKLEGFLAYESCKIVPMENEIGYDVYLLGPYKRSLESFMRKHTMTHLAAVNLGLDMCASLAVARQAGFLYVDLKPENIYISADQEYRIGDLGFISLNSLKYASLPDKYRSAYTAPEIKDAYAEINTTVDTYAAGMILYQAYNGGILPEIVPGEKLVAPAFADYEMAEIILKACDPDPAERWADPIQMGQALVAYMQRNGANNDPIVPASVIPPEKHEGTQEDPVENTAEEATTAVVEEAAEASAAESTEGTPETGEQISIDGFTSDSEESAEDIESSEEDQAENAEELSTEETSEDVEEDSAAEESVDGEDETLPDEEDVANISYDELSDDVGEMLAIADDLIDHELPAPAVAPDPVEITIPDPIIPEEEESEEEQSQSTDVTEVIDEDDLEYEEDEELAETDKKTGKKILTFILVLILLAGLAYGGYYFYNNYYLQNVDSFTLNGSGDVLNVEVKSGIADELLTVVCTDTHGNRQEMAVVDGVAVFKDLKANTLYNVTLEISGLHKLSGTFSDSYTTPTQTTVLNFSALTGNEDGTVMLSFNIDGSDSNAWTVSYVADGEEIRTEEFSDHLVNISGLTVGKEYTFILDAVDPLFLAGETQISYIANTPVFAQDLAITGLGEDSISVSWKAPENAVSDNWIVHCFDEKGYDQTITVSEPAATFEGINPKSAHTVEVTAEGMSTGSRTYMSDNAVTVTNANLTVKDAASITVNWDAPSVESNWIVNFTLEGFDKQEVIRTSKSNATLSPVIPGASYTISIQLEDGTTVFGGNLTAQVPEAVRFNGKKLSLFAKDVDMQFKMCLRPDEEGWNRKDVKKDDYTTTFTVGDEAAFVVYVPSKYSTAKTPMTILYIIKDEAGNMLSYSSTSLIWRNMWTSRYCELDIPVLPAEAGNYTMEVYFNGGSAHTQEFTMVTE